ncbi:MAG: protein kinase [Ignavibacteriales bacterium]|nr:protein kinase [Ignavibacteriales bacterium]
MIGQTISHYRILEKLGEGGMGVVYKAQDLKLDRLVALKFLPPHLSSDEEDRERFIHEAKAASSLDHPNICNVHEIDETPDGQVFIVMAIYEGTPLNKKIEKGPFKIDEGVDVAIQAAEGLQAAHEKGIVHRDVKSSNIMMTQKGRAVIMDFGLALSGGSMKLTKAGSTLGTVPYMSPEQARGEKVDQRTDIWSLGVILYELIAGRLPFQSAYGEAIVYSILNEEPPLLTSLRSGVPMELERILKKAIQKDRASRYQHVDEMLADLRTLRKELESDEAKEPLKPVRLRWKQVALYAGVVTLGFVLVAGGLFLFRGENRSNSIRSIAVLPFQNLSAEGPHAYFAGGLHDELLTQLSKVAALKVISRTSVMGYAGKDISLKQIAAELGVGSIVEGSIQVVDGRLRVNVQLIDAETDAHLWAERYDRTLEDAFLIQSDVAQQIVAAVGAALSTTEREGLTAAPTTNADAYQLYLQGLDYLTRPGFVRRNVEVAQEMFERAVGLDQDFALARAALSETHGWMYWFRYDPSAARATRQREEAEAALALMPDLPQAHIAMGLAHYWGRRDYHRALDELRIALKGLPSDARLWSRIGFVHRRLGNWDEVLASFEKATQRDPRDANLFLDVGGNTYQLLRRYGEAVRAYDRSLSLAPDVYYADLQRGRTYVLWQGRLDTLRAVLTRLPMHASVGAFGTVSDQYVHLLFLEQQADSLLRFIRKTRVEVFEAQDFFLPASLYAAWAHQLRGDQTAAHISFESARTFLDSVITQLPDDWRIHASRGLALAGLGHRDEALREAHWLQQSPIYREDAFDRLLLAEDRARILAQIGETDAALEEIEKLLSGPSLLSDHTLRLDARWDPIREHPRFKALLAKYAGD